MDKTDASIGHVAAARWPQANPTTVRADWMRRSQERFDTWYCGPFRAGPRQALRLTRANRVCNQKLLSCRRKE